MPHIPQETLHTLRHAGWGAEEISRLTRQTRNRLWVKQPQRLLAGEAALHAAGFAPVDARELVIEHQTFSEEDPARLGPAVECFRALGFDDDALENMARKRPRVLFADPAVLRQWHDVMATLGLAPMRNLNKITCPPKPRSQKPPSSTAPPLESIAPAVDDGETVEAVPEVTGCIADEDGESSILSWVAFVRSLLKMEGKDAETQRAWADFRINNDRLFNRADSAWIALTVITQWLNVANVRHVEERETLKRIMLEPGFRPVLELSKSRLTHRLWAIRTILEGDIAGEPELLLHPWDSFPRTELYYRKNVIEGEGKRVSTPKYLALFFVPTRTEFHRQFAYSLRHDYDY